MSDLKTIGEERKEWEDLVFKKAQELLHLVEQDPFQFNGDDEYKSITLYPDYENEILTVHIQKNEVEATTLTRKFIPYEPPRAEVVHFSTDINKYHQDLYNCEHRCQTTSK